MKNKEIANLFSEIAEYLEMEGVQFKPYAYQKAARVKMVINTDAHHVYQL